MSDEDQPRFERKKNCGKLPIDGVTFPANLSTAPELVLTAEQWKAIQANVRPPLEDEK